MAFNFGQAGGGISAPSAWNQHVIYNMPVNFGRHGGIR